MKNNNDVFFSFLVGFIFGATLFTLHERRKSRLIQKNFEVGFLEDKYSIQNDFDNVVNDINKSYLKLENDYTET